MIKKTSMRPHFWTQNLVILLHLCSHISCTFCLLREFCVSPIAPTVLRIFFAFHVHAIFACHAGLFLPFVPALLLPFCHFANFEFLGVLLLLGVMRAFCFAGQWTQVCACSGSEYVFSCRQLFPLESVTLWKRDKLRQLSQSGSKASC